jgi:hypothetical protein
MLPSLRTRAISWLGLRGLLLGGVLLLGCLPPVQAGILCDGVDDFLATGLGANQFVASATKTIAAWVRSTGAVTPPAPVFQGGGIQADKGGYLGLYRSDTGASGDQLWAYNYQGAVQSVSTTFTVDTWVHLTMVHTGGTLFLYKDGVSVGSIASSNTDDLTNEWRMCQTFDVSTFPALHAELVSLRTYNVALSAAEIATLALSHLMDPGLTEAPTAFWPLDDCADGTSAHGLTLRDRSGNGRHLTADRSTNATGVTCRASDILSYTWGPQ